MTDLSPKEIVFGKLGGAFYNAKEMILLPIVLCVYLWFVDAISTENLFFLLGGIAVMNAFAAMLGLHAGMTYANSRTAIATSIGTLLFLFLGVATCMRIMLAFSNSFDYQFTTFLGFIAGGSVGLYVALELANPIDGDRLGVAARAVRNHSSRSRAFCSATMARSFLLSVLHLRIRHLGDAGAGDLRVRRRDRAHDRARRMTALGTSVV